jgi:hypothetical protein
MLANSALAAARTYAVMIPGPSIAGTTLAAIANDPDIRQ